MPATEARRLSLGKDRNVTHKNQRMLSNVPRQAKKAPSQDIASIIRPMPTMMRNAKKGMITGGRSSGGNASSPPLAGTPVAGGDEAAESGYLHRKEVALLAWIRNG